MQITLLAASGSMNMIMILLMFVVMYFFMILPQVKKNKAQKKFWGEIKKGDKIVTSGGIHGKIIEIKDNIVIIEIEDGSKMKIEKSSISAELSQSYVKAAA
ncbi:MAG: preprotein translocase subunit YajC [Flavobacteriales bacterium]|nr:preprotein translocase subunit YajC [Flavobacteriales bacterium]